MDQDTRLLRNPQGTEGILLEEAFQHLKNVDKLQDLFLSWGYLPSRTPSFDYYDIYQNHLKGHGEIYRLVDRDGDLLALRSDITLFLAKQLGMNLSEKDLPVRIFYADSILRHQGQTDISKNEFFQVGVELVGVGGMRGDVEVLALMTEALEEIGVETVCHIGSRDFYNLIVEGLSENDQKWAEFWIRGREFDKVEALLSSCGDKAKVVAKLFSYIGEVAPFITLLEEFQALLPPQEVAPLHYLIDLFQLLNQLDTDCAFRLDLSEIGQQSYYTGISFSVYVDGADSAVAAGGRYDKLLKNFGFSAPSTGFSILLRKLEPFSTKKAEKMNVIQVNEENPIDALKKATELRKQGKVVIL